MLQRDPVQQMKRRAERYWYEDGIWEIGFGLINVLLALYYYLVSVAETLNNAMVVLLALQALVIFAALFGVNRLVKWLKERLIYPRTGYVAYRKPPMPKRIKRNVTIGLISALVSATAVMLARSELFSGSIILICSVFMAAALVFLGLTYNLIRLYVIAGLTVLLGYGLSLLSLAITPGTGLFFGGFGLLLIISGCVTLLIYLRRTRIEADSGMDEALDEQ